MNEEESLLNEILNNWNLGASSVQSAKFYAHVDINSKKIVAVSSQNEETEGIHFLELEEKLALAFLSGDKNPETYEIFVSDTGEYSLDEIKPLAKRAFSKIYYSEFCELEFVESREEETAVFLVIDSENDTININYNGERLDDGLKFYVTKEGNPSFLVCTLEVNREILDSVMSSKKSESWPNPLKFSIPGGVSDISVFVKKSKLKMSMIQS